MLSGITCFLVNLVFRCFAEINVGSFSTCRLRTEKPVPHPQSNSQNASAKNRVLSQYENVQLYILMLLESIALPPNCIERCDGKTRFSRTKSKAHLI